MHHTQGADEYEDPNIRHKLTHRLLSSLCHRDEREEPSDSVEIHCKPLC